jgi:Fic-DOC domain mobile mystery protein B
VIHYPAGATPIDADELRELKQPHLTTRGQLDEFESVNIMAAEKWAFGTKHTVEKLLSAQFIKVLHQRMFSDVWGWAGAFRKTEKNIGVMPWQIPVGIHQLCEDVKVQIDHASYPPDEIAARFHHRLVSIHPFPNGNGRHSRIMADLLLASWGRDRFSWGRQSLTKPTDARRIYIEALREADRRNYKPLLDFVRS